MINEYEMTENIFNLTYDASIPCVEMQFHGYATSHEFRSYTEELLFTIKKYKVSKVLADTTYMKIMSYDDQRWFLTNWLPRAIKAGYRACAMIHSKYFFNRIAVQNVAKEMDSTLFTLNFFDDKTAAKEWLQKFPT